MEMMTAVTSALGNVIGWIGTVVTALTDSTGQLNPLLPLLAIGVAVSAFMFGIMAIRRTIWGA